MLIHFIIFNINKSFFITPTSLEKSLVGEVVKFMVAETSIFKNIHLKAQT